MEIHARGLDQQWFECLDGPLLTRLLKASNSDFINLVRDLSEDDEMKITQQDQRSDRKLAIKAFVKKIVALLDQPIQKADLVGILKTFEKYTRLRSDEGDTDFTQVISIAETHHSLEVVTEALEIVLNVELSAEMQEKVETVLLELAELSPGNSKGRFTDLQEDRRWYKKLFGTLHLHERKCNQGELDKELNQCYDLLRTKSYDWVLPLLSIVKTAREDKRSDVMAIGILDSLIVLEPIFKLQPLNFIEGPINPKMIEAAIKISPQYFLRTVHFPTNFVLTEATIYFKYAPKFYNTFNILTGYKSLCRDQTASLPDLDAEEIFVRMVTFTETVLQNYSKKFIVISEGGQGKEVTEQEKLEILESTLLSLFGILISRDPFESHKLLIEKDIFMLTLAVSNRVLQTSSTATAWNVLGRLWALTTLFTQYSEGTAKSSMQTVCQRFAKVIETNYRRPTCTLFQWAAYSIITNNLELTNSQQIGQILSAKIIAAICGELLDSLFNGEFVDRLEPEKLFGDIASEEVQRTLNDAIVDRLAKLNQIDNITILAQQRTAEYVMKQWKIAVKLLNYSSIHVSQEASDMLIISVMRLPLKIWHDLDEDYLRQIGKKNPAHLQEFYHDQLSKFENLRVQDPFKGLTVEQRNSSLAKSKKLEDKWLLELYLSLSSITFFNIHAKNDYSEEGIIGLFTIFSQLTKISTDIEKSMQQVERNKSENQKKPMGLREPTSEIDQELQDVVAQREKPEFITHTDLKELINETCGVLEDTVLRMFYDFHTSFNGKSVGLQEQVNLAKGLEVLIKAILATPQTDIRSISKQMQLLIGMVDATDGSMNTHVNMYTILKGQLFQVVLYIKAIQEKAQKNKVVGQRISREIILLARKNQQFLRAFLQRSVATNRPLLYGGQIYSGPKAKEIVSGMYIDQLNQIVNYIDPLNTMLFQKMLFQFIDKEFIGELLQKSWKGNNHEKSTVEKLSKVLVQRGIRREIAETAVYCMSNPVIEAVDQWLEETKELLTQMEMILNDKERQTNARCIRPVNPEDFHRTAISAIERLFREKLLLEMYTQLPFFTLIVRILKKIRGDALSLVVEVSEVVISHFLTDLQNNGMQKIDEDRLHKQVTIMKIVVCQYRTRKDIRVKLFSGHFFHKLLQVLGELADQKQQPTKKRVSILQSGFSLVCWLLPNRNKTQRTQPFLRVLALIRKFIHWMNYLEQGQLALWQELMVEALSKALRHNNEEINIGCIKTLRQLMDLEVLENSTTVSIIDAAILENQLYRLASMESDIKAFFFAHRNKQVPAEPIRVIRRSFVLAMKKYNDNDEFYQVCERLLYKSYDQTTDGVRLAYIVYDPTKHSFTHSQYLKKPFREYEPMIEVKQLLAGLMTKIFTNEREVCRRHLDVLQRVLTRHPLLVSYIADYQLYGQALYQKAVDAMPGQQLVLRRLLLTLCLDCPVVTGSPGQEALLSTIIQRDIILEFERKLSSITIGKKECWLLLILASLLQLKEVNRLARLPLGKDESLFEILKSTIEKHVNQKVLLLICEPTSMLLGQQMFDNLDGPYKLYDRSQYGDLEGQLIPLEIMFKETQALYALDAENLTEFLPVPKADMKKEQIKGVQIGRSFAHDYTLPLSVPYTQGSLSDTVSFQAFIEDDMKFKRINPEPLLYERRKNALLWSRLNTLAEILMKTPIDEETGKNDQQPESEISQAARIQMERIEEIKQGLSKEPALDQEEADNDEDSRFNKKNQNQKMDFQSIMKVLKEYKQQYSAEETQSEKPMKGQETVQLEMLPTSYSEQAKEQLLFIKTINDPSLRREVLMEVPSEYLEKYPENLRREAQNIKQGKEEHDNQHENAEQEVDQVGELKPSESLIKENFLLLNDLVDPTLKMELLMECPSDQLAMLPSQIQEEAQELRWGQRDNLVMEHEQLQAKAEIELCLPKKPQQPYTYPSITADLFQTISQETIKASLNTLCYAIQDSYRSTILVNLLQNKRVQAKLVTSLLIFFRNPQSGLLSNSTVVYFPEDTSPMTLSFNYVVRINIISVFESVFERLLYNNTLLLRQRIPYDGIYGTKLQNFEKYNQSEDGYYPYVEILDYALSCGNFQLSGYLLKGTSQLPEFMLRKLVNELFQPNLPLEFLDSLQGLNTNEMLERLFNEVATIDYLPEISTQTKLLKYKFAQPKFLRSVHLNLLKRYHSNYNEFLNQIYHIYSEEEVRQLKELGEYKHAHRGVLQYLLNQKRKPSSEPIKVILKLPFCVDFATKKSIFRKQLRESRNNLGGSFELKLNRANLFQQSFIKIMAKSTEELTQRLCIQYEGQLGQDAGGLTRDWFQTISQEIFNRDYALFNLSTTGNTYQPSRLSYVNADHLRYFKFVGRVVGKALYDEQMIGAYFTRSFYKLILGEQLQLQDLQEQDEVKYKGLLYYLENPLFDEMYFTYTSDLFEQVTEKELVPGGGTLMVTEENKREWVQRTAEFIMRDQIQPQINSFLEGLHELIPKETLELFDSRELELLISGLPSIDRKCYINLVNDLKDNVQYDEYEPTDKVIEWFWQALEGYEQEQLAQLVQFITGTSRIPAEGFKGLRARDGLQKIQIVKSSGQGIPVAHTCFNRLDLPEYSTQEILEARLKAMLKWGNEGFGVR